MSPIIPAQNNHKNPESYLYPGRKPGINMNSRSGLEYYNNSNKISNNNRLSLLFLQIGLRRYCISNTYNHHHQKRMATGDLGVGSENKINNNKSNLELLEGNKNENKFLDYRKILAGKFSNLKKKLMIPSYMDLAGSILKAIFTVNICINRPARRDSPADVQKMR